MSRQPCLVQVMVHQKELKNMEYLKYLSSITTNHARRTREIWSSIAMSKAAFNKKKALFTRKLDFNLRKKLVKCCIWSTALYGAETWILHKVYQIYPERSEMWCWRRMEFSWTDRVKNEEVLQRVMDERNILQTTKRRKANWIIYILRRSCCLIHVIEGKLGGRIEVMWGRGRRRKQLIDYPKQTRVYWKLKEEVL